MDASMWVAKTGLSAQSTRMTVIANNLANVNTIGFKKDRANPVMAHDQNRQVIFTQALRQILP